MEYLGFVEGFWSLGIIIIMLTIVPTLATQHITKKQKKEWYWKFEPIMTRLALLLIFE